MAHGSIRVAVFAKTDLGRTRDHNEDTFLVADLTRQQAHLQPAVREHEVGERGSIFLVADGMGGAAAGELASAMATDAIYAHLSTAWPQDPEVSAQRFAFHLRRAVEEANERIHRHAKEHPEVRGMGTTVTAAGIFGTDLYLAQVGDSRAYLIRDGVAIQITKDQSLMQRLVDAGELTEEEAEQSERRNIILQALGPDPLVTVDLTFQELRRGDTLVLCSDGLSGQVKKEEIARLADELPDLPTLCGRLVELANERGGPDNITVIAAHFTGDALTESDGSTSAGYQVYALDDDDALTEPVPAFPDSEPAPLPGRDPRRFLAIGITLLVAGAALLYLLLS